MRNKKGTFMMILGLLFLMAAFLLMTYNIYDGKRAENASGKVLEKLENKIAENEPQWQEETIIAAREMPAIEIDGYRYIGILEITTLELSLPVMEEWDEQRLKIAPCRYKGSIYEDNLIIAGHNYARHFSPIKNLPVGTEVTFTDVEKNVFRYQISEIELLNEAKVEEMVTGDWNLTLFTCTYGGEDRYAVRCVAIEE